MRPSALDSPFTPAFLGIRQQHRDVDVRLTFRAALAAGEHVGLVVRQSEDDHVRVFLGGVDGGGRRRILAVHRRGGAEEALGELTVPGAPEDPVTLTLRARGQDYAFLAGAGEEESLAVAVVDGRTLDSVATGGFLGLWTGVYATSNGRPTTTVVQVESLEYVPVA